MIKNCWECENLRHDFFYDEKIIYFPYVKCEKIDKNGLADIIKMDQELKECRNKRHLLCPFNITPAEHNWDKKIFDIFYNIAKSIKDIEIKKLKKEVLDRRFKRLITGKIKEIEYQNKIFTLHPYEKNRILILYKDKKHELCPLKKKTTYLFDCHGKEIKEGDKIRCSNNNWITIFIIKFNEISGFYLEDESKNNFSFEHPKFKSYREIIYDNKKK
jgi:hypothetical protein